MRQSITISKKIFHEIGRSGFRTVPKGLVADRLSGCYARSIR